MFDSSLVELSGYAMLATRPRLVVCGNRKTGYSPIVRGDVDEGGETFEACIGFYWRHDYETKAEAAECGRHLLRVVKHFRQASI